MIAPLDFEMASRLFEIEEVEGVAYLNEDGTKIAPVTVPLDPQTVVHDLGPDGVIAKALQMYEDRSSQRDMAAVIATLYNDGGVGLLEAGTGVGKSLGYLIPALRWAALNNERTVVSTNTINLQEQLVQKDLPFLEGALEGEQPVRFALLKGWRNYLCKLRLAQATLLGPALLEDDVSQTLEQIAEWAETTDDGSLSGLPTPPRVELWDEISAEPDLCTRNSCPHFQECFLFKARRKAAQAQVVVVNHHLLMSDVAVRRAQGNWDDAAVIPPYARVIIDEGHHLEDAAAAHLGTTTTRRALQRLFSRLDRRGRGLIVALTERLSTKADLLSVASLDIINQRIVPSVRAAREKSDLVFDLLIALLQQQGQPVVRLTDEFVSHPVWKGGLNIALTDLLREIQHLSDSLTLVRERLEGGETRDEALSSLINELRGVARRLTAAADSLRMSLRPPADAEPSVRWIEVKGKEGNLSVTSVPLDLAPILREHLFQKVKTAVVTSATLVADGQFNFLSHRLGLGDDESGTPGPQPITAIFPSPFNYAAQALLALPTDIEAPNVNAAAHFESVVRIVKDIARASGGGVFVLFTSHRDVRATASALRASGLDNEFPILVHGENSRDALLREFKSAHNAILLGTASYWEGVDVPGAALRALVIARLPFRVPSEPVTAAQCEAIAARGGDPFMEYMVPHASLRLKQGFGRLIRSAADRGVIVLADPRVITKRYGRDLVNGLPPAERISGPWTTIVKQVRSFYAANPHV
jgi:ATP-dependent DNA helicase DinG